MNFKRNLFVITSALVGALALSGCEFDGPSKFKHFDFINAKEDKGIDIDSGSYVKYGKYEAYQVNDMHGDKKTLGSAYEVFRDYSGANHIPSEGRQKILVIPVEFSDYKVEKLGMSHKQFIENINKAFFGSAKNNAYVSVGEYFNKSSYGKLKLDGKVCDKVYTFPLSVSEIKEKKIKRDVLANEYYKKIIEWYKENYEDIENYEIEGLKEGKNVPIYLVYTHPSEEQSENDPENFFWAYTFNDVPLSWSSASFMYLQYSEPDAHTYIHEMGHLFGLTDYYPTTLLKDDDPDDNIDVVTPEPLARIDMMDCSIGDESSFSKMFLNWVRPTYVYNTCQVTLKSFTDSGDVLLLANSWNKTVFDEYYLFEYYNPTNLNTYDVSVGNNQAKLPRVPGIKIYHVDARLGYFSSQKKFKSYCEDGGEAPTSTNIGFAHDNNTYNNPTKNEKNYLYSLVLNHGKEINAGCATDANLYRLGDEIPELTFNRDGSKLNYKISIFATSFSEIVLNCEKVENITK